MDTISPGFSSTLKELVFIDNPALVGPLNTILCNYTNLRKVVMTENRVYDKILEGLSNDLVGLKELMLSRNQLSGPVPSSLSKLKSLRVLDLSHNHFDGYLPGALGNLTELLTCQFFFPSFHLTQFFFSLSFLCLAKGEEMKMRIFCILCLGSEKRRKMNWNEDFSDSLFD